jgi:hypothetical protein
VPFWEDGCFLLVGEFGSAPHSVSVVHESVSLFGADLVGWDTSAVFAFGGAVSVE